MEDFRRQFSIEAAENLRALVKGFQSSTNVPDALKREVFRALHTIKGTAQTFGFKSASRLAHELETLLSALKTEKNSDSKQVKKLLLEGFALLLESLEGKISEIPASFTERVHKFVPPSERNLSEDFAPNVPAEWLSQLSFHEKTALRTALDETAGKNVFCFEVAYEKTDFADRLISFREMLNQTGEIIATLPGAKLEINEKINFRILYASAAKMSEVQAIAEAGAAEIIFNSSPDAFPNGAAGVLAQIVEHGKTAAKKLGKQIEFIFSADANLSPDKLKTIFDVSLHLIRNAVDHGIETSGKIEINLKSETDGWRLTVSDDGRGIDLEKIKAKARREKLIGDVSLTERETIDLIFLAGFSTKQGVSEISGRGVGLDVVKSEIEKRGGAINVQKRAGRGTTFEIFLPWRDAPRER